MLLSFSFFIAWFSTVNVIPVETQHVLVEGNVTIAVVLAIHERSDDWTCSTHVDVASVLRLEAIRWYIDHINTWATNLQFTKIGKY